MDMRLHDPKFALLPRYLLTVGCYSPKLVRSLTQIDTAPLEERTVPASLEQDLPLDSSTWLGSPNYPQTTAVSHFAVDDGACQTSPSHGSQNTLARSVVRTVISGPKDALNLLFDVRSNREPVRTAAAHADSDTAPTQSPHMSSKQRESVNLDELTETGPPSDMPSQHESRVLRALVRIWQSCHFVRMGWLTAREAIQYVDL